MATTTARTPAAGGSGQVPVRLVRWLVFGLVVVVTAAVLAVISLGVVQGLQLLFHDWWTEFAVAVAALTFVLFVVTIAVVVLAAQSPSVQTPFGVLSVQKHNVIVHVIRRSGDLFEPDEDSIEQAKTWTVDSDGNLTVWSADRAVATYPAGWWEGVEREGVIREAAPPS